MAKYKAETLQEDKDKHLNELAALMQPRARGYITTISYSVPASWIDDILQYCLMLLPEIVGIYDGRIRFWQFARFCFRRRVITYIKLERKKETPNRLSIDYSSDEGSRGVSFVDTTADNPVEEAIFNEQKLLVAKVFLPKLSKLERQVFELLMQGQQMTQISVTLGLEVKQIDNALSRIKVKGQVFRHEGKLSFFRE